MNIILASAKWQFKLIDLAHVVIVSNSLDEHIDHVWQALTLLNDAGFSLKLNKCKFFKNPIECIGPIIKPKLQEVSAHKTEAIWNLPEPSKIT